MNRLIRTEWLKQRTTRSFVAGVIAAPAVSALVAVAVLAAAGKSGNPPLEPDNLLQVIGAPAPAITLIALVLGVLGMAGEYRHQTITTTFLATPRRRDVVVAKLTAYAIAGALMAAAAIVSAVAVAVPWLASSGVDMTVDGRLVSLVAGVVGSTALFGALGVSVGALLRNQTVAVAAVLVWLLAIEGIVGDAFPEAAFLRWLPGAAGRDLVDPGGLAAPVAAAVFTTYVAAFAAAATRLTLRRDIS